MRSNRPGEHARRVAADFGRTRRELERLVCIPSVSMPGAERGRPPRIGGAGEE